MPDMRLLRLGLLRMHGANRSAVLVGAAAPLLGVRNARRNNQRGPILRVTGDNAVTTGDEPQARWYTASSAQRTPSDRG